MTLRGERVRSKSEAMIADTLYRLKIPYKYECPLTIRRKTGTSRNTKTIYPDFTCLNVRLRQEFVWEHFNRYGHPKDEVVNKLRIVTGDTSAVYRTDLHGSFSFEMWPGVGLVVP